MNLKRLREELKKLVSLLASEDMTQALPEGVVDWIDSKASYICPETRAGIYLKILSHSKPGRPGTKYSVENINGRDMIVPTQRHNDKLTINISAKSLEDSDDLSGQMWIERILDRIWDRSVLTTLLGLGLSIIRIEPTIALTEKDPSDGSDGWDNRSVSVVSVDIVFHYLNEVRGKPIDYITKVSATGSITGTVGANAEVRLEVDR